MSRAQFSQMIDENRGKYAYISDALSVAQLYEIVKSKDKKFTPAPEVNKVQTKMVHRESSITEQARNSLSLNPKKWQIVKARSSLRKIAGMQKHIVTHLNSKGFPQQ